MGAYKYQVGRYSSCVRSFSVFPRHTGHMFDPLRNMYVIALLRTKHKGGATWYEFSLVSREAGDGNQTRSRSHFWSGWTYPHFEYDAPLGVVCHSGSSTHSSRLVFISSQVIPE